MYRDREEYAPKLSLSRAETFHDLRLVTRDEKNIRYARVPFEINFFYRTTEATEIDHLMARSSNSNREEQRTSLLRVGISKSGEHFKGKSIREIRERLKTRNDDARTDQVGRIRVSRARA